MASSAGRGSRRQVIDFEAKTRLDNSSRELVSVLTNFETNWELGCECYTTDPAEIALLEVRWSLWHHKHEENVFCNYKGEREVPHCRFNVIL